MIDNTVQYLLHILTTGPPYSGPEHDLVQDDGEAEHVSLAGDGEMLQQLRLVQEDGVGGVGVVLEQLRVAPQHLGRSPEFRLVELVSVLGDVGGERPEHGQTKVSQLHNKPVHNTNVNHEAKTDFIVEEDIKVE